MTLEELSKLPDAELQQHIGATRFKSEALMALHEMFASETNAQARRALHEAFLIVDNLEAK